MGLCLWMRVRILLVGAWGGQWVLLQLAALPSSGCHRCWTAAMLPLFGCMEWHIEEQHRVASRMRTQTLHCTTGGCTPAPHDSNDFNDVAAVQGGLRQVGDLGVRCAQTPPAVLHGGVCRAWRLANHVCTCTIPCHALYCLQGTRPCHAAWAAYGPAGTCENAGAQGGPQSVTLLLTFWNILYMRSCCPASHILVRVGDVPCG